MPKKGLLRALILGINSIFQGYTKTESHLKRQRCMLKNRIISKSRRFIRKTIAFAHP